jgi:hypothetical protein
VFVIVVVVVILVMVMVLLVIELRLKAVVVVRRRRPRRSRGSLPFRSMRKGKHREPSLKAEDGGCAKGAYKVFFLAVLSHDVL